MMNRRIRNALVAVSGLCSGAWALGQLRVESAAVGERTLVITVDDSIQAPDLSKIRIEGYEIESAVFVEEIGPDSARFTGNYLDMTRAGNGKVIEFAPSLGAMILELPDSAVPMMGTIVADTSFGGILRKVVDVDGQPRPGKFGRRWVLKTVAADLPDAVQDCDISFKTRLDLNQALGDFSRSGELSGVSADSEAVFGQMDVGLKSAQVLFQPMVTGRVQVRNGIVSLFRIQVNGDCEVMANLKASLTGAGDFNFEEPLPGNSPLVVPLGSGLFLRVQNRPFLHVETRSRGESFSAQADFRVRNSIKGELGFSDGQWRPLAENKMTWDSKNLQDIRGDGDIKMSIKPRMEMLLAGVQGPVITFEPYVRFTSVPNVIPIAGPPAGTALSALPSGSAPAVPGWTAPVPGIAAAAGPFSKPGSGNRELSLGANIYMEARTNFTGPSELRNFLLFSREQTLLSPPREGTLVLKEADSNRIALQCQTYPKSEYYIIQQKPGTGPWETVQDRAIAPKIRTNLLKPNSQYRFRALGVNAMGISAPFPPEGIPYLSPSANRPPFLPLARYPDSGAVLSDSLPVILSWKGGDPDAGAKVQYTVYVDTKFPPLSIRVTGMADSVLSLPDLQPGGTYFWKVVASDGMDKIEGPVRVFTIKTAPAPAAPGPSKAFAGAYPLVYLPKGSFRREDGRLIQVGPFFLGKYEVTQGEFQKITGQNPSYRLQDSLPVDRITWEEADSFCRETGGRLPTEAEWEYAARAGNAASFYWGAADPGEYAWYRDNSENRTQKVGLKKPNAWGLHDMAGNVFEWVEDWYGDYGPADADNPKGPAVGTAKVIRGASWYSESGSLSLAARYNNRPGFRNFKVGFRCAKEPDRLDLSEAASLAPKPAELAARPDASPAK